MNQYFDSMIPVEIDARTTHPRELPWDGSQRSPEIRCGVPDKHLQPSRIAQPLDLIPDIAGGSNPACQPYSRYLRSKRHKNASISGEDLNHQRDQAAKEQVSNLRGFFSNSTSKELHSPHREVKIASAHPCVGHRHHHMPQTAQAQSGQDTPREQESTFADSNAYLRDDAGTVLAKENLEGTRDHSTHQKSSSQVNAHPERFSFGVKESRDASTVQRSFRPSSEDRLAMTEAQFEEYNQLLTIKYGLLSVISRSRSDKDALHQANQLLLKKIDLVAERLHATFNSTS